MTRQSAIANFTAILVGFLALHAQSNEQIKLLASDGDHDDWFGFSVAVDTGNAIVGSMRDADDGPRSGSVYLIDAVTGQELGKLRSDDAESGDAFGRAIALSGSIAVIGAPGDDDHGVNSGSAYIFDTTTGKLLFKLLPEDGAANKFFGNSVGVHGTMAIVGGPRDRENGESSGAAYLFDVLTGQQLAKLTPNDPSIDDVFGDAVDIWGSTAVVGSPGDDDLAKDAGAAYVFDASTGNQIGKLLPLDGGTTGIFGSSLSIDETTVIVGAPGDDENGEFSGAAYLFDTVTGTQLLKLLPEDGEESDLFADEKGVGLSGRTAIVGARNDDDLGERSGSAYLFDTSTGEQIAKLGPNDGQPGLRFGDCVAIDGSRALSGAFRDDDLGVFSGSAYLFGTERASWTNYGKGWPGTNGVPSFIASKDPIMGDPLTLELENSLGAFTLGTLVLGLDERVAGTPLGGLLLVIPHVIIPIAIPEHGLALVTTVPDDTSFCGLSVFLQALEFDPSASHNVSFTPGLKLDLGL